MPPIKWLATIVVHGFTPTNLFSITKCFRVNSALTYKDASARNSLSEDF